MLNGAHIVIYSEDAEADPRSFVTLSDSASSMQDIFSGPLDDVLRKVRAERRQLM